MENEKSLDIFLVVTGTLHYGAGAEFEYKQDREKGYRVLWDDVKCENNVKRVEECAKKDTVMERSARAVREGRVRDGDERERRRSRLNQ